MKTEFVMHDDGGFHIEVDGVASRVTIFEGIAVLKVNDRLFIGVSDYYGGLLPTECVLEVSKVE